MANGFTADLDQLRRIHHQDLPLLLSNYDAVLRAMEHAMDETPAAFDGAADLCAGARDAWTSAGSIMHRIATRNRDAIDATRRAMAEIEKRYRELDDAR